MGIARFIGSQLGNPRGRFGRYVMARALNRGNDEIISGALAALELAPSDHFLDVGFGGGASLQKAARVITSGRLFGVDRSADMVAAAKKRFANEVAKARFDLATADVTSLPYPDGSMDKLLTTNTVYFWPDLGAGLRECVRVLAPGGRMAIGISGAEKMRNYGPITSEGFVLFEGHELAHALGGLGLTHTKVIGLHGRHSFGDFVILGDKPPTTPE